MNSRSLFLLCAALTAGSTSAQVATVTLNGPWVHTPIEKPEGQWMIVERACEPNLPSNHMSQFQTSFVNMPAGSYSISFDSWFEKPIRGDLGREEFFFQAGNGNSAPLWQQQYGMPNVWSHVSNTFTVADGTWNGNFGFVVQVWGGQSQPSHYRYHTDNFCVSNLVTGAVIFKDDFEGYTAGNPPTSRWSTRGPCEYDVWTIIRYFFPNTRLLLR